MNAEESTEQMLLETMVNLEAHNLLEFASTNAEAWYLQRKIEEQKVQNFNPEEKQILDNGEE